MAWIFGLLGGDDVKAATASQGPLTASASGNCVEDATIGTVAWTSPGNAFSNNTTYATASVDGTTSRYIKCTNFGFSIPTGVTIAGIVVAVERKANSTANGGSRDAAMRIVKGGTIGATDKSTATAYTTSDVSEDHGGAADLWGETWSVTDVNASNFGAAFATTKASATGAAHSVTVDVITITVHYSFTPTFEQASYRWFDNQDTASPPVDVGSALGAQNTAITALGEQEIMRLRMNLHVASQVAIGGSYINFKLQYAARGVDNVCDTSFTNETYADVTTGTAIAYANNTNAIDAQAAASNANDPTHSGHTRIMQEYNEANNTALASTIQSGQDGVWDFALKDNGAPATTTYCFRMVDSSGSALTTYTVVPQLTTTSGGLTQENYRWYKGQDAVPNNSFAQTFGDGSSESVNGVVQTSDGGYAVTGYSGSLGTVGDAAFIAKYDSTGAMSWSKTWGGDPDNEYAYDIIQTSDGGYAITGNTTSYGGYQDMFVAKYTSGGTLSWSKTWGGVGGTTIGYSLLQTSDGGYAITGTTNAFGDSTNNSFLTKFDAQGSHVWSKVLNIDITNPNFGNSLVQTKDGGYIVVGRENNDLATVLIKYSSTGTIIWQKTFGIGELGETVANGIAISDDGTFAITGRTDYQQVDLEYMDMFIAKFDASGNNLWAKTWTPSSGVAYINEGNDIVSNSKGGYTVVGTAENDFVADSQNVFVVEYDGTGQLLSENIWGGSLNDIGDSLAETSDGGYVIGGTTSSYGAGNSDGLLIKYDAGGGIDGCAASVCQPVASEGDFFSLSSQTSAYSLADVSPTITSPSASQGTDGSEYNSSRSVLAGSMTFARTVGFSASTGDARSVVNTSDGGYVVAGTENFTDVFLAKYDAKGEQVWYESWGYATDNYYQGVQVTATSDGGYAIFGYLVDDTLGLYATDAVVIKLNSSGAVQWSAGLGPYTTVSSIKQTSDSGYILAGSTTDYGSGSGDALITKLDSSGSVTWARTWGGSGVDAATSIVQTTDGGYVTTGSTGSYGAGGTDAFIAKYDSSGTLSWSRTWGGTGNDSSNSLIQNSDGGYAISGSTGSYGAGSADAFIAKYDSSGTLSWSRTWGGGSSDESKHIIQASDGGYAISGSTTSYGAGSADAFIAKYDSSGTLSWSRTWGDAGSEINESLAQSLDGGFIVVGGGSGGSFADGYMLKYSATGQITGCGSPTCQSPSAGTSSPSAGTSSPSAGTSSPSFSSYGDSPPALSTSPTATFTTSLGLWSDLAPVPGASLGAQDTAVSSLKQDDPLRLGFTLKILKPALAAGSLSVKLQVAAKVGTCDTSFTGESYQDIGTSPYFAYYNNSALASGDWARPSSQPIVLGAGTLNYENYAESGSLSNRHYLPAGNYALWDVSLTPTVDAIYGSYCFRVVDSSNAVLDGYTRVVELSIPSATKQQLRHGKFFDSNAGTSQPFYW